MFVAIDGTDEDGADCNRSWHLLAEGEGLILRLAVADDELDRTIVELLLRLGDSLGLKVAQGLSFTETFYWDLNEGTRAWSQRWSKRNKNRMPTMIW